jgi:glycosyltransferase involved in cell wall biosynthesis
MILFLNFAPIEFMGGAEKWMYETAKFMQKKEESILISVSPQISNFYSKLVLQRKYDKRTTIKDVPLVYLTIACFIPLTKEYIKVKEIFSKARKIYARYELLEMCILVYFGGFKVFNKTISGIHFPLIYQFPMNFFEKLHNFMYKSSLSKWFLQKSTIVHVITNRDKDFIERNFQLKNVIHIPTSTEVHIGTEVRRKKDDKLHILFVGELSKRKGADILINVIKNSPLEYRYSIAGNGVYSEEIKKLCKENKNCKYYGFVQGKRLTKLYQESDVLFLPSRAEGFPLVYHEAMANGLMIVDSPESTVGLPDIIEQTAKDFYTHNFIKKLQGCFLQRTRPTKIVKYYNKNFALPKIQNNLFNIIFN